MDTNTKVNPQSETEPFKAFHEQYREEIKALGKLPENAGLADLPAELYPFMSERELRAAILLSTHTKGVQWSMDLIFTASLDSEVNTISMHDGVFTFQPDEHTAAGIIHRLHGAWYVNSGFGNAQLGSGYLDLHIKERGGKDNRYSAMMEATQNFSIRLYRAKDDDELTGEAIVNPSKWSAFTTELKLSNQRNVTFSFNQSVACSPGYDWELPSGASPCSGHVYSVGGSHFHVSSGYPQGSPTSYTANNYTLVIRKPQSIEQGLVEFVKDTNGVDEIEAKKILMRLPTDDYGWIAHYPTAQTMAIDYIRLKQLGVDAKVQLDQS